MNRQENTFGNGNNRPVTIYGFEYRPMVGAFVEPDGWNIGGKLNGSNWEKADFYIETCCGGPIKELAVNIQITGRTLTRRRGCLWLRCSVEFVGDGEPSTMHRGWLKAA